MSASSVDLTDVHVEIVAEMGRKQITLEQARNTKVGDVIDLDMLAGEAFDLLVNGRAIAECEVVVVTDLMAVRLTRMIDPEVSA